MGQCGCNDPYACGREPQFTQGRNRGQGTRAPRFQTIMNHTYAPFCNRFCTKTFEQDQWRDKLFTRVELNFANNSQTIPSCLKNVFFRQEKEALDGWRYCYKSKPWERPERTKPWDGDNSEFRRIQTTILPPLMKNDLDVHLRGIIRIINSLIINDY